MTTVLCTCLIDFFSKDNWVTIITTLAGLGGSIAVAYWIFNSEQQSRELEEKSIAIDHYNLFAKLLSRYSKCINSQIKHIDKYLNIKDFHLTLGSVIDLPTNLLDKLDVIKLEKEIKSNNVNSENFHELIIKLYYTKEVIGNIDNEFFRFFERLRELEKNYKENQIDLIRYHNFELLNLLKDNSFKSKFEKPVLEYNNLIYKASSDKTIFPNDGINPVNKEKLFETVFEPAMEIIMPLRAEDSIFLVIGIKLNAIANTLNDIKNLKAYHQSTIKAYRTILEGVETEINKYLN